MKKLLNTLAIFGLGLASVNQVTAFTINNDEDSLTTNDKFSLKTSTSNFEVDNKNELLPNKSYDRKNEMQENLIEWQKYKKENNIIDLNIEKLEAKFGALDSSGNNIDKNFYQKLLISDNVEVQKLNFYVYDKVDKQYRVDFIGDFKIDNIEYKNISLSGYDKNQYFTSWQILSDFFIITEYQIYDLIKFRHKEIITLDLGINDSYSIFVYTLNEYKYYFNSNPKEKENIVKPYWSFSNIKTKEEFNVNAWDYKSDDRVFTEEASATRIAIELIEDKPGIETNIVNLNWVTILESHGSLAGSSLIRKYEPNTLKGDFELSLNATVRR
ncbi:hypothetical protein [Spiroplasma endosymbiont of Cantharis lateralis]|uniref:hypothetical protein n=1 Tax=Spiroplasma endosymbiont of Cantharis lateralis TaxID=3066277 RepID=UPI00313DA5E8